jgi:RNA-directed DNA polymerase
VLGVGRLDAFPAFLVVAWSRVKGNKGARSAGVDRVAPRAITAEGEFLEAIRTDLKGRRFSPTRVREKLIPKTSGKLRRLGIATATDRVVQAVLKLVLEPIFEADFKPCSYGFRPKRRAQDAIAEIHYLGSPPVITSGCSRLTSRRALTKSRIPVFRTGCAIALGTSASWTW